MGCALPVGSTVRIRERGNRFGRNAPERPFFHAEPLLPRLCDMVKITFNIALLVVYTSQFRVLSLAWGVRPCDQARRNGTPGRPRVSSVV